MEEQKARLDMLRARAKRMMSEGKIIGYEEIADADRKLETMKSQLKGLANASGGAMKEIKNGIEQALLDLGESCKKASDRFASKGS
jgi:hypothetical protein